MCFKCLIIVTSSTCLIIETRFFTMWFPFLSGYSFFPHWTRDIHAQVTINTTIVNVYFFYFQGQDQLKKLQEEMKDLLQNLGLKQSEVSIKRWKDDVLRVARGLWITNYPLFWLGRSISKPGYDVSRYSLYPVYVFVVVRCFPCCCCCLFCGCCCCRCCCCRWCLAS